MSGMILEDLIVPDLKVATTHSKTSPFSISQQNIKEVGSTRLLASLLRCRLTNLPTSPPPSSPAHQVISSAEVTTFSGRSCSSSPREVEEEVVVQQQEQQQGGGLHPRSRGEDGAQYGLTDRRSAAGFLLSSMMDEPNILRRRGLQVMETAMTALGCVCFQANEIIIIMIT